MIDLRHPLAVLATRMPWEQLEEAVAPLFVHEDRKGRTVEEIDLFGSNLKVVGAGVSSAGRPLPVDPPDTLAAVPQTRLQPCRRGTGGTLERERGVAVLLRHGVLPAEASLRCTQIGRFRTALNKAGAEEMLKACIDAALAMKVVRPSEFERLIVDITVQGKAIAHPTDSRLLEVARHHVVKVAKGIGISLKQAFAGEGKQLRRRAGGYAHARQFKRLKRVVRRQRTILQRILREVERKLVGVQPANGVDDLRTVLERAWRIARQQPKDKNKPYAMHAPEVECIGKGKARRPYEFGVKTSIAVTHRNGLMVGSRTFSGNPYDGHILAAQLEQTRILLEDAGKVPIQVIVDLGYRGVDADYPGVEIIHRGKYRSLTRKQRDWLKRRQAVEPAIGHLKADHRMNRCWLKGARGDAIHAVRCGAVRGRL